MIVYDYELKGSDNMSEELNEHKEMLPQVEAILTAYVDYKAPVESIVNFLTKATQEVGENLVETLLTEINTITSDVLPLVVKHGELVSEEQRTSVYEKAVKPVTQASMHLMLLFKHLVDESGNNESDFHIAKYLKLNA